MREASLERWVRRQVEKVGGSFYKWVCPGVSGVPDRILLFPGGRVVFVELKRPGVKDGFSLRQSKMVDRLRRLGCKVWRVGTKEEFLFLIKELGLEI